MVNDGNSRGYEKFFGMSGLASRAGKIVYGAEQCRNAVRRGKVFLAVLAEDASANTAEKVVKVCGNHKVPVISAGTIDVLSRSVGKQGIAVFGVTDNSFTARLIELYKQI